MKKRELDENMNLICIIILKGIISDPLRFLNVPESMTLCNVPMVCSIIGSSIGALFRTDTRASTPPSSRTCLACSC